MLFGLIFYCTLKTELKDSWFLASFKDTFEGGGQYLRLAMPGTLTFFIGWTSTEVLALFAGYLGAEEQSATVLLINYKMLISSVPLGLSLTSSAILGNLIGANMPHLALKYCRQIFVTNVSILILASLIVIFTSSLSCKFYTSDFETQHLFE